MSRPTSFDDLALQYGQHYRWMVLFVIGAGAVAGVLCTSSFNVAVPALTRHFGLGQGQVQWAMTGFMSAMTVGMLPTPWLLDRLGFRLVFLLALGVLAIASIAGFFASTFPMVVCARIFQGASAGVLQPMGILALMRLFPLESQGRAFGTLTFSIVLAPAVAPALAGIIMDHFGWEAIFLLGLPFAIGAGIAGYYLLPAARENASKPFDWAGLGWLTLATLALIELVSNLQQRAWDSPWTLGQITVFLAAVLLFIRHARRFRDPIIQLHLFGQRTFVIGTFVSFTYGFGVYASTYLIPVFLQNVLAYSPTAAGVALVPSGITLVLMLPLAGRMADRFPPKWITTVGLVVFGTSFFVFSVEGIATQYREIIGATVVGRIGLGLILPAINLAMLHHVSTRQQGQCSVIIGYARQIGGVMGVAICAVFIQWREDVYGTLPAGLDAAYSEGFVMLAAVILLAAVAASFMKTTVAGKSSC